MYTVLTLFQYCLSLPFFGRTALLWQQTKAVCLYLAFFQSQTAFLCPFFGPGPPLFGRPRVTYLPHHSEVKLLDQTLYERTVRARLACSVLLLIYSVHDLLLLCLYPHCPEQAFSRLQSFFKALKYNISAPVSIFHYLGQPLGLGGHFHYASCSRTSTVKPEQSQLGRSRFGLY